jgi:hypothetical protein
MMGSDPQAVERLARALDAPQQTITTDTDINDALAAAQALAPSLYPREAWRSALKDRMLREATSPPIAEDGAGTRDGIVERTHSVEVVDPTLGRLTLADVESISEQRAQEVARNVARILARQHRT